jgi:hypothetical protein
VKVKETSVINAQKKGLAMRVGRDPRPGVSRKTTNEHFSLRLMHKE